MLLDFDFNGLDQVTAANFAVSIPQDRTEAALLEKIGTYASAQVSFGATFERFEDHGDHVSVWCVDAHGERHEVKGAFLVGADGAKSAVRAQLGWELKGKTYPHRAFLADVRVAPHADSNDGWLAQFSSDQFIAAIRYAPGTWRLIDQSVPPELTEPEALRTHAWDTANKIFGEGGVEQVLWSSSYRKHERQADKFVQGRVILAGDAAHLNSPAGGQGMNTGLRDAHNLAWKLAFILKGWGDQAALLSSYELEQRDAFLRYVAPLTDHTEKIQTAPGWMRKVATKGLWVVRRTGVEQRAMKQLSMLFIDYGGSPLLSEEGAVVGQRIPNIMLPQGRLFGAIGLRGLLIARGEDSLALAKVMGEELGLPCLRWPLSLDELGFRDFDMLLIRPDHVVGLAYKSSDVPQQGDIRRALGLRAPQQAQENMA